MRVWEHSPCCPKALTTEAAQNQVARARPPRPARDQVPPPPTLHCPVLPGKHPEALRTGTTQDQGLQRVC